MLIADRSRHAAVAQAIEQALAGPKPRPPAPQVDNRPASSHPPQERANDAPRAKDLLALMRGGQDALEAARRLGLPEHLIGHVAQRIRNDIIQAQRSAAMGNGQKRPPVDKQAMVPV